MNDLLLFLTHKWRVRMFSFGGSTKKGKKISDGIYYFAENRMLDCNQYALVDEETGEIAIIDAGNGKSLKGLFEGMEGVGLNPQSITKIFITHEHVDHVLGLYPLMKQRRQDPPEILAYGETAKILRGGDVSQIFPGNLGIRPSMFGVEIIPLDVTEIKEDAHVEFGEFFFEIHYTPGHSIGSISYHEPEKKILFPGDLVFTGGSFGRYDFPGGSLKTLQDSIEYVNKLDVKYLLPGHTGWSDKGNSQIELANRMVHSIGSFY